MVDLTGADPRVDSPRRFGSGRRRARRAAAIAIIIPGLLLPLGLLALIPAEATRASLGEARTAMEEGRAALLSGDAGAARRAFGRAESAFAQANGHAVNPVLRLWALVPVAGRSPDAVHAMADAGALAAQGGRELAAALEALPGATSALSPRHGRIPLAPIRRLQGPLGRALDLMRRAHAILERAPRSWLIGPVAGARVEFDREMDQALRAVEAAEAMARALPAFLGAEGPRRYFLGAQNPAELRGTGGFLGAYAILTAEDGRLRLGPFSPIEELRDLEVSQVRAPNPDYARRYDRYGGAGFWRNINMTPDFPSAAQAIEALYARVAGERVDGALVADPFALAALLEVTGPVRVPGTGAALQSDGMIPFVTNEAYAVLTEPAARKRLLGHVAAGVFRRFLAHEGSRVPARGGRALAVSAAAGHLLLHARDPEVQAALEAAGVAGELATPEGDFLAVIANNASGTKIDFYAERSVRYGVRLNAGGAATAQATVHLTNDAPLKGQPREVIGPYSDRFRAGQNVSILSVYCAASCLMQDFRRDRVPGEVGSDVELGHPVFTTPVRLPSGGTRVLEHRWSLPEAWTGDDRGGLYQLTFRGQTTIRPTQLIVDVWAPEGMRIIRASRGMEVEGRRATWEGSAEDLMTFEVEFQRPAPARAWRALARFLGRPVIQLGAG